MRCPQMQIRAQSRAQSLQIALTLTGRTLQQTVPTRGPGEQAAFMGYQLIKLDSDAAVKTPSVSAHQSSDLKKSRDTSQTEQQFYIRNLEILSRTILVARKSFQVTQAQIPARRVQARGVLLECISNYCAIQLASHSLYPLTQAGHVGLSEKPNDHLQKEHAFCSVLFRLEAPALIWQSLSLAKSFFSFGFSQYKPVQQGGRCVKSLIQVSKHLTASYKEAELGTGTSSACVQYFHQKSMVQGIHPNFATMDFRDARMFMVKALVGMTATIVDQVIPKAHEGQAWMEQLRKRLQDAISLYFLLWTFQKFVKEVELSMGKARQTLESICLLYALNGLSARANCLLDCNFLQPYDLLLLSEKKREVEKSLESQVTILLGGIEMCQDWLSGTSAKDRDDMMDSQFKLIKRPLESGCNHLSKL